MLENNKIEDIKRRLYDSKDTIADHRREGVIHAVPHKVSEVWQPGEVGKGESTQIQKPHMSILKKFFIGSIAFFVISVCFALYMFMGGSTSVSSDNIDITVLGNSFTKGGDELPLQVEVVNRNNVNLELANLIIEYPRGASDDAVDVMRLPRITIGTIKPGESITRNIKVTLFGEEKSIRNIKISLEYHSQGSNAILTKEKQYGVTISSAPLSLLIDAPQTSTSDQLYSFKITATLNTSLPQEKTMLQLVYPSGFVFDSAIPSASFGNSVWDLGALTLTNPVSITIRGRFVGQDGDQQVIHAYAGSVDQANQSVVNVVYNSLLQTVTIVKPFLEARILVNGQDVSNPTVSGGEKIGGQISWVNNLSTRITDAQIILSLGGNSLDRTTIESQDGFYDSTNNQIIWDKNTISQMAEVEPGERGIVSFSFKSIPLVGLSSSVKEPQINLNVSIRGRQPSLGTTFEDVNNFSQKIIKIASDFQIASSANYSSGSIPPKAETETRYNITWTLSNSANTITGATARSVLPIYIKWAGNNGGTGENVSYNEITREVIWNIGTVLPNTGVDLNREASFTLSLTPSTSQAGSVPQLMKDTFLSGKDSFTNTVINSRRGPITTLITNDPNFKNGDERVIK